MPVAQAFTLAACIAFAPTPPINADALARLREAAQATHSSTLYVAQGNQVLGNWHFDGPAHPVDVHSITKAIVALVFGTVMDHPNVPALDTPVAHFFPEWRQGRKAQVTLAHVFAHTTCLQDDVYAGAQRSYAFDFVKFALAAELACTPGSHIKPSNTAVQLLSGITEAAFNTPVDALAERNLFAPLGIADYTWSHDAAGHPDLAQGLAMLPEDLAKLGQLVIARGTHHGQRLLPSAWVDALGGQDVGATYAMGMLWHRMYGAQSASQNRAPQALVAYGLMGQWLIIVPEANLVVVRQYDVNLRGTQAAADAFDAMANLTLALLRPEPV